MLLINTISHTLPQSRPQVLSHEDGMMVSEPTLSSLPQLTVRAMALEKGREGVDGAAGGCQGKARS